MVTIAPLVRVPAGVPAWIPAWVPAWASVWASVWGSVWGSVAVAVCVWFAAALPGQNLFTWNQWNRIAPQWQVNYTVTTQEIRFRPYCAAPCPVRPRTGISQTVLIPRAGQYQLRFRGAGGGTGTFQTAFSFGSARTEVGHANWHVAPIVDLPAGNVTVTITTDTSDFLVDIWSCAQPELFPVITPAVGAWITDAGDPNAVRVELETEAIVLAASFNTLARPLAIPPLGHGLVLDPAAMIILAVSPSGNIRLDLSREASKLGYRVWATMHVQAVSATSFGTSNWF